MQFSWTTTHFEGTSPVLPLSRRVAALTDRMLSVRPVGTLNLNRGRRNAMSIARSEGLPAARPIRFLLGAGELCCPAYEGPQMSSSRQRNSPTRRTRSVQPRLGLHLVLEGGAVPAAFAATACLLKSRGYGQKWSSAAQQLPLKANAWVEVRRPGCERTSHIPRRCMQFSTGADGYPL